MLIPTENQTNKNINIYISPPPKKMKLTFNLFIEIGSLPKIISVFGKQKPD